MFYFLKTGKVIVLFASDFTSTAEAQEVYATLSRRGLVVFHRARSPKIHLSKRIRFSNIAQ